jgi:hypothetical protein
VGAVRLRSASKPATPRDVPVILRLIRELAEYERLAHEVRASEASLHEAGRVQFSHYAFGRQFVRFQLNRTQFIAEPVGNRFGPACATDASRQDTSPSARSMQARMLPSKP